ncbi:hypothetical protein [uncultured Brachybacterium sp.]|uniref:hypothetical protein n=1 Tax=uncultured Brachybacterium sp. TaxID=189680 RepID=UPI002623A915|nr:hypothetical protein [uncultured Brachybacterium sp.]
MESDDEFFERFAGWLASGHELTIGPGGCDFILSQYTEFGYPNAAPTINIPEGSFEVRGQIDRMLTRSLNTTSANQPVTAFIPQIVRPKYLGGDESQLAITLDVIYASREELTFIASSSGHWDGAESNVSLEDGSISELLCDPNLGLASASRAAVAEIFASTRLFIVGGQKNLPLVQKLKDSGVPEDAINWIEIDRSTSPKIIKRRLSGLKRDTDLVACWTGQIGHDGSKHVEVSCTKSGASHLGSQSASDLYSAILQWAKDKLST